jgi:hypothetical protein
MSDIFNHVYALISSDPVLVGTQSSPPHGEYSGILTGGFWDRPIKRPGDAEAPVSPAGSTPAAFDMDQGGRIRYCGNMIDDGERLHRQEFAIPTATVMTLTFHFYAPAHRTGKQRIRDAKERVYDVLRDYRFPTNGADGPYARTFFEYSIGITDSEEFVGALTDYCRYQVVYRKREAA